MRAKLLSETEGQRTFSVVLDAGDEVMACLLKFVQAEKVVAGQLTAIGAFSDAALGYFDWERKDYIRNTVDEQVEVAAFNGDVAIGQDGKPSLHVHCVLGHRSGAASAGHLLEATVRPTLEVVVVDSPAHLRKRHDPASGLALIDPHL